MGCNDAPLARPIYFLALPPRQRQIAEMTIEGLKVPEIARRMGIAIGTVRTQLGLVFLKFGVRDRLGLALVARKTQEFPE